MTIEEYRALPEEERRKIQIELLKEAPKASTALEYGDDITSQEDAEDAPYRKKITK